MFLGDCLAPISAITAVRRRARRAMRRNLARAFGYNLFALALAASSHLAPLIAALAMSDLSLLLTVNALGTAEAVNV